MVIWEGPAGVGAEAGVGALDGTGTMAGLGALAGALDGAGDAVAWAKNPAAKEL